MRSFNVSMCKANGIQWQCDVYIQLGFYNSEITSIVADKEVQNDS
jgi:hypothetical protein